MSDTSTDTVVLNLEGNFPSEAQRSASAASALSEALGKMTAAAERAKDPEVIAAGKLNAITAELNQQAAITAKIAAFDANRVRELAQQEALYKKMKEDALGITAEREKQKRLAEYEEASEKRIAALKKAHADAARAKQSNAESESAAMESAAGSLGAAGAVVLAAAAAIASASAALAASGYKEAVATTSRHEVQGAVGTTLGGNYEQTVRMALRMGIDPDQAWEQTKRLLGDKFSSTEIPTILRIKAGMSVAGQNGDAFVTELQKLKLEPKVKSADVDRLYKMGVDSKLVYQELAKTMGTDAASAAAKVKAGLADSEQVIRAIEKVAGDKFGGLADKLGDSVPGLAARMKGEFLEMFNVGPEMLGPLKNVLKNILSVIEGPAGAEMKAAFKELFGAINDTFLSQFQGEEGKRQLVEFAHEGSQAVRDFAGAVRELKPFMGDLINAGHTGLQLLAGGFRLAGEAARLFNDTLRTTYDLLVRLGVLENPDAAKEKDPRSQTQKESSKIMWADTGAEDRRAAANDAGADLPAGMAEGIMAGESQAIEAAGAMADKALAEAKARLGVHSPSEEFGEVGDYSAEGFANRMADHPGPAAAGRAMAANALGAAGGATGGASAGGGGGAGGSLSVVINVQGGGGGAAQEWEALQPVIEAAVRRIDRDRREAA